MQLVKPDKTKHKYIVAIDFGHGETSAAICSLDWDKNAGQREDNVLDIDLDSRARKKVITSAICLSNGSAFIGDEAFEHTDDNVGIRVCFKQKPSSLTGNMEKLMIAYMKAVYARIRESLSELSDSNHIVYIARPSGWSEDQAKELYRQMALTAGIPLAGLTSESRAAIFYAKSPSVNFSKEISKGCMVFDLGSSTLDYTYLSDDDSPIDHGYNLGASIIDEIIYEEFMLSDNEVAEFIKKHPVYRDALLFKARKFKEDAYGRNEDSKTVMSFFFDSIISENADTYDEYSNISLRLKISNLNELNELLARKTNYMTKIKESLEDFRDNYIPGKPVKGIFLTGGASRMNFIRPIIAEVFNLPIEQIRIDNDNPSLTISRGIALLGTSDAITSVLVSELRSKIPTFVNNKTLQNDLIDKLSQQIAEESWKVISDGCDNWIKCGKTTETDELKSQLKEALLYFQKNKLSMIVNKTLQSFLISSTDEIRKKMNEIISLYAPGREISSDERVSLGETKTIRDSLSDMSYTIAQICDNATNILGNLFWIIVNGYLWGIFAVFYYVWKYSRSDEDKRKDKANKVLEKEQEVKNQVKSKISTELKSDKNFSQTLSKALNDYFMRTIESNLKKVIIPIE